MRHLYFITTHTGFTLEVYAFDARDALDHYGLEQGEYKAIWQAD